MLASNHYEIKARSELCLIMGKLPSELRADKVSFEEVNLLLRVHNVKKHNEKEEFLDELGMQLGTVWSVEDDKIVPQVPKVKIKQNKVILPLTHAVAMSGMDGRPVFKHIKDMLAKAKSGNTGMSAADNANSLDQKTYKELFGGSLKASDIKERLDGFLKQ